MGGQKRFQIFLGRVGSVRWEAKAKTHVQPLQLRRKHFSELGFSAEPTSRQDSHHEGSTDQRLWKAKPFDRQAPTPGQNCSHQRQVQAESADGHRKRLCSRHQTQTLLQELQRKDNGNQPFIHESRRHPDLALHKISTACGKVLLQKFDPP
jgi:hypothetical protein